MSYAQANFAMLQTSLFMLQTRFVISWIAGDLAGVQADFCQQVLQRNFVSRVLQTDFVSRVLQTNFVCTQKPRRPRKF